MNEFNSSRVLPSRKLELPLELIGGRRIYRVVNGYSIECTAKSGVEIFDEKTLKDILLMPKLSKIYGAHGFTETEYLVTDNEGNISIYHYNNPDPVDSIKSIGLYGLWGESHWISDTYTVHMHGTEGYKRGIVGERNICLFDWKEREIIWKHKPDVNLFGYAIGEEKLIYQAHKNDGSIYCVDLKTGNKCWQKDPLDLLVLSNENRDRYDRGYGRSSAFGNPRIFENLVIIGMHFHMIIALDIESGEKVWEYQLASDEDKYEKPLHRIISKPYSAAVTESGKVYRLESADVVCGYDKHCHLLFLIELDARTGKLLQRLEVKAPEGDLQEHIIDPYEKNFDFGFETLCDVSETHYYTCFSSGPILAINLETGVVDWHVTLPTGSVRDQLLVLNNRLYTSSGLVHYIFEGEGGYIPD
ncbi:MAG: PQQ-binding-like beta-propeller repeat protein [Candidatus Thiodiazotropha sp. (ex Codakia orbicularis)]|nr:PQQ-binding-like beta-propeller repeat protein [Candidatus Thiodiazotropha sp. (ex Codakia orbicularis)]